MSKYTTHTELPWVEGVTPAGKMTIRARGKNIFIGNHYGNEEANAEFIVRAVNSHYDLLDILKRLTEKVSRANYLQHSGGRVCAEDWSELYALENESKQAIAKAERGPA